MELKDKKVILTGGSSGIGWELAKRFAAEGCITAVLARRADRLESLRDTVKKEHGKDIIIKTLDVTDKNEVRRVFGELKEEMGFIDLAVLNSGVSVRGNEFSSEDAEITFNVNVMGLVYCIEELLPDMKARRQGVIAGVSSLADARGFGKSGFYCASKAAATIMLESLRVEARDFNVKIITIKPGFVRTEMTAKNKFKMPLLMDADKAADIIIKGLKAEKSVISFPAATAVGSRMLKLVPNFIFDRIANRQK